VPHTGCVRLTHKVKAGHAVSPSNSREVPATNPVPPAEPTPSPNPPPAAPAKARILVVEDNLFVRESLIRFINRQPDLACCGHCDTVAGTPGAVAEHNPDLILLDLRLKDGEAFDLIPALRQRFPNVRILILSQCDEVLDAERTLRAGAKGYIAKQEAPDEVLNGIRAVLQGRVYVSPELAGRLVLWFVRHARPDEARAINSAASPGQTSL
jgi:DNA-binding NarL/FixJ family response regulator